MTSRFVEVVCNFDQVVPEIGRHKNTSPTMVSSTSFNTRQKSSFLGFCLREIECWCSHPECMGVKLLMGDRNLSYENNSFRLSSAGMLVMLKQIFGTWSSCAKQHSKQNSKEHSPSSHHQLSRANIKNDFFNFKRQTLLWTNIRHIGLFISQNPKLKLKF